MKKRIAFISDLHLRDKPEGVYADSSTLTVHGIERERLELLKDALNYRYREEKLDLLVFMGDYVFGGDSAETKRSTYTKFKDFLKSLSQIDIFRTDDYTRHIIILPGNHDIDRASESLDLFRQEFDQFMHPYQTYSVKSEYHYGLPILFFQEPKLIVACISTVENSAARDTNIQYVMDTLEHSSLDKKDELIQKLKASLYKDIPSIQESTRTAFSTANNRMVQDGVGFDFDKIVISHNPLVTFEDGITMKEYNGTVGGYDFMKTAAEYGYTYFIHGHNHSFNYLKIEDQRNNEVFTFKQIGVPDFNWGDNPSHHDYSPQIVELELSDETSDKIRHMQISPAKRMFEEVKFFTSETESQGTYSRILVDFEIEKIIQDGRIIKNGDSSRIEAASYDCALGYHYKLAKDGSPYEWEETLSCLEETATAPAHIELKPNATVLIYTLEEFNVPDNMVFHASPMSSWARKGLRVDISHFVDPGFQGPFCFPVTNVSDKTLSINSREPVMSIELMELDKKAHLNWNTRHPQKAQTRNKKNDN